MASTPLEGVDWGWGPLRREHCMSVKLLGQCGHPTLRAPREVGLGSGLGLEVEVKGRSAQDSALSQGEGAFGMNPGTGRQSHTFSLGIWESWRCHPHGFC